MAVSQDFLHFFHETNPPGDIREISAGFAGLNFVLASPCLMLACAESNFSNLIFEYIRENESFSKTTLACSAGAQGGSIHKKSRDIATLNNISLSYAT